MSFLESLSPIIRGTCNQCGISRNLLVTDLGGPIPCDRQDWRCQGTMEVVYCGPACFLPNDIRNAHCTEGPPDMHNSSDSSGKRGIRLVDVGQDCDSIAKVLLDLGFPNAAVQRAVQRCGDADTAFEWLISSEGKACVNAAFTSEAAASKPSSPILGDAQAENTSSGSMSTALDITECSVCLEHMPTSCAAMRCSGVGGSRHYYHAECLSSWIRQCHRESKGQPTCPECRGPVQIQPRRFEEFLAEKGKKLCVEEREAMGSLHRGVTGYDEGGWFNVRNDIWAGAAAVVVVGVATALYFGIQALSGRKHDD